MSSEYLIWIKLLSGTLLPLDVSPSYPIIRVKKTIETQYPEFSLELIHLFYPDHNELPLPDESTLQEIGISHGATLCLLQNTINGLPPQSHVIDIIDQEIYKKEQLHLSIEDNHIIKHLDIPSIEQQLGLERNIFYTCRLHDTNYHSRRNTYSDANGHMKHMYLVSPRLKSYIYFIKCPGVATIKMIPYGSIISGKFTEIRINRRKSFDLYDPRQFHYDLFLHISHPISIYYEGQRIYQDELQQYTSMSIPFEHIEETES